MAILNDPSDFLIFDNSTNEYVVAEYPSGGAGFTGGGTLEASGDFYVIGLAGGGYTITGNLVSEEGITLGLAGTPTSNYARGSGYRSGPD